MDALVLAGKIDNTLLKPFITMEKVVEFCQESAQYAFASVCVNPVYVKTAHNLLKDTRVKVGTVIGFPLGATTTGAKVNETVIAINNGAEELDMVINIGWLKSGAYLSLEKEIKAVVNQAVGRTVKVIIETCYLNYKDKFEASKIIINSGADFIKTSTGFGTGGATLEDVRVLKQFTGDRIQIKAAGGISSLKRALDFLAAGADRIGTSRGIGILNELKNKS